MHVDVSAMVRDWLLFFVVFLALSCAWFCCVWQKNKMGRSVAASSAHPVPALSMPAPSPASAPTPAPAPALASAIPYTGVSPSYPPVSAYPGATAYPAYPTSSHASYTTAEYPPPPQQPYQPPPAGYPPSYPPQPYEQSYPPQPYERSYPPQPYGQQPYPPPPAAQSPYPPGEMQFSRENSIFFHDVSQCSNWIASLCLVWSYAAPYPGTYPPRPYWYSSVSNDLR